MSIDSLEHAVNEVADKDWSWWPFLWLRPAKTERLSLVRLAVIAVLYGLPFGVLLSLVLRFAVPTAGRAAAFLGGGFPLLLFLATTVIVGPMWNRRAARLDRRARFNA